MLVVFFFIGLGLGIGLSCLGVCLFMNIWKNKQDIKKLQQRKNGG